MIIGKDKERVRLLEVQCKNASELIELVRDDLEEIEDHLRADIDIGVCSKDPYWKIPNDIGRCSGYLSYYKNEGFGPFFFRNKNRSPYRKIKEVAHMAKEIFIVTKRQYTDEENPRMFRSKVMGAYESEGDAMCAIAAWIARYEHTNPEYTFENTWVRKTVIKSEDGCSLMNISETMSYAPVYYYEKEGS